MYISCPQESVIRQFLFISSSDENWAILLVPNIFSWFSNRLRQFLSHNVEAENIDKSFDYHALTFFPRSQVFSFEKLQENLLDDCFQWKVENASEHDGATFHSSMQPPAGFLFEVN